MRELAIQISERRAFWVEGTASAKNVKWEHAGMVGEQPGDHCG